MDIELIRDWSIEHSIYQFDKRGLYEKISELSDIRVEQLQPINCNDIDQDDQIVIIANHTGHGNYCGSLVQKSNYDTLMEAYGDRDGIYNITPGYRYSGFAFNAELLSSGEDWVREMLEQVASLSDCPLLDKDKHSALEIEAQDEAWEDWAKSDFISKLESQFDAEIAADDDAIDECFRKAQEKANVYWVNESGDSMYIDLDRIVEAVETLELAHTANED